MTESWVVVMGTLADGFDFYGPFESWEDCDEWADPELDICGFFLLKNPSETKEEAAA